MPSASHSATAMTGGTRTKGLWTRLGEVDWLRRHGLVDKQTGNVVVWGAPDVEKVGRLSEGGVTNGPRLV